jgi:hypothetical protein
MPFGWAAGAAALGSVATGLIGSNAAQSAASTEANAANQASQTELGMFNQAQTDLQPYMAGGTNALAALQKMLGIGPGTSGSAISPIMNMLGMGGPGGVGGTGSINPATFQASPGYQYQLQQGTNAVTNSAAAQGGLGGNALRALQQTGQGLANQNFNQYLSQANGAYQGQVGNLANLTGMGQQAGGAMAGNAMNIGGMVGGNQIGAGNALASGTMGSANALTGAISGVGNNALLYGLMNQAQSGGGLQSLYPTGDAYLTSLGMPANPTQAAGLNSGLGGLY